jgi:hypothetical protein
MFMDILNKRKTSFFDTVRHGDNFILLQFHIYIYTHSQNNFKQCPYFSIISSILYLSMSQK